MSLVVLSEQPKFASRKIFDSSDPDFQDASANTGLTCVAPHAIQLDDIPSATTAVVQVKLNFTSDWVEKDTIAADTPSVIIEFPVRYNYVRVIRTAGTGTVVAHSQG